MKENFFEKDSILKIYLKLALPVVFNMVITIVYNVADTYFITKTGNLNIVAGVSLGAPIFMILMALGNLLGQGGSSLMSRLIGQNDKENTYHVSSFCFYAAMAIGFVMMVLMLVFQRPFLNLLGATSETYEYAWQYYIVLAFGAPIAALTFVHSNILRCEGLAVQSMVGSVAGTVTNIILDPVFISLFGWGAFGAALATVVGYAVTVVIMLYMVFKKSHYISVNPKKMFVSGGQLMDIVTIGVPAALTNIMTSVCTVLINQNLLPYGNDKIALMGIVMKVMMIGQLVLVGFSFGGAPIIGYFYGAKNKTKLKELVRFCYGFEVGLGMVLLCLLFALNAPLMKAFVSDMALLPEAVKMMQLQTAGLPFVGMILMTTIFCQSMGKALPSLILSLSRQGVVFIAVILLASTVAHYNGVIASQLISDVLSAGIAMLIYLLAVRKEIEHVA